MLFDNIFASFLASRGLSFWVLTFILLSEAVSVAKKRLYCWWCTRCSLLVERFSTPSLHLWLIGTWAVPWSSAYIGTEFLVGRTSETDAPSLTLNAGILQFKRAFKITSAIVCKLQSQKDWTGTTLKSPLFWKNMYLPKSLGWLCV